jgi:hypothetical protein
MSDFPCLTPEQEAHVAAGVGQAAFGWTSALRDSHHVRVWGNLDPDFRLAMVQQWLMSNPAVLSDPSAGGVGAEGLAALLSSGRQRTRCGNTARAGASG